KETAGRAPLNVLHLHVEREYLDQFHSFYAPVVNYSLHVTGIPMSEARAAFPGQVLAGGIDEVNYRTLTAAQIRWQWDAAVHAAGKKFILTPGCSVPNDSSPADLARLPDVLRA